MQDEIRQLVRKSTLTYEQIAFGSGVTVSWLQKFMSERFKDSGHERLTKVRDFLLKQKAKRAA